tara:strand:+ start:663 stop:860 length:198 start_codon:yes stop_codon:yes gene_type:complete
VLSISIPILLQVSRKFGKDVITLSTCSTLDSFGALVQAIAEAIAILWSSKELITEALKGKFELDE